MKNILYSFAGAVMSSKYFKRPLYYWRPAHEGNSLKENFGDSLFPLIASRILGKTIKYASISYPFPKLLAGGSLLHRARPFDTIWGVGLRTPEQTRCRNLAYLDVRAVRGHMTRDFLKKNYSLEIPSVFGDPALLLPQLFPEWKRAITRGRVGLVPHFTTMDNYGEIKPPFYLIRPDREPREVIPEILSCEFIISSSLHGIVVAEAYGIPARWLNDDPKEPKLKFYDYYSGTNREGEPAQSISAAVSMGGQKSILDQDFSLLLNAFPKDLQFQNTEQSGSK